MEQKPLTETEIFLKKIQEDQERRLEVLERVTRTINSCEQVAKESKETFNKMQEFQDNMGIALKQMAEKFGSIFYNQNQGFERIEDGSEIKELSNIEEVSDLMKINKKIVFLTGAGLSVASGLPTFRGAGGVWTKKEENFDCKSVCTRSFLEERPDYYWEWNNQFVYNVQTHKPNVNHQAIYKLQEYFDQQDDKSFTLVTQNIDGYHTQIQSGKQFKVHEIHGNINFLRCRGEQECNLKLLPYPKIESMANFKWQTPKCETCGELLRPHVLYFDENYTEHHYSKDTVLDAVSKADMLFVVGTMLETNLARNIVSSFATAKKIIVEINPQPIIKYPNNRILKGKAELIIPHLIQLFLNKQKSSLANQIQLQNNIPQQSQQQQAKNQLPNQKQTETRNQGSDMQTNKSSQQNNKQNHNNQTQRNSIRSTNSNSSTTTNSSTNSTQKQTQNQSQAISNKQTASTKQTTSKK